MVQPRVTSAHFVLNSLRKAGLTPQLNSRLSEGAIRGAAAKQTEHTPYLQPSAQDIHTLVLAPHTWQKGIDEHAERACPLGHSLQ